MKCMQLFLFVGLVWCVAANAQDADPTPSAAKRLWDDYVAAGRQGLDNPSQERWAGKFETAAADPLLPGTVRLRFMSEAAVLYNSAGNKPKASAAFSRLHAEAIRQNDKYQQWIALDFFANENPRPKTAEELKRTEEAYQQLRAVLADPPPERRAQFRRELANSYLQLGVILRNAGARIKTLGDQERQQLLERSVQELEICADLAKVAGISREDVLFELARSYAAASATDKAAQSYKAIAALPSPRRARSYMMLEAIKLEHPKRQDRIKPMEDILTDLPPDKYWNQFKQQLAFEYLEAEKWDKAIAILSDIGETDEGDGVNAYNMFLIATALRRSGRLNDAESLLNEIVRKYPDTLTAKDLAARETRVIEHRRQALLAQAKELAQQQIDASVSDLGNGIAEPSTAAPKQEPARPGEGSAKPREDSGVASLGDGMFGRMPLIAVVVGIGLVALAAAVIMVRRCRHGQSAAPTEE